MTILATAIAQIQQNTRLLAAVGLDAEKIIARMNDTAALYSDTIACSEAGRQIAMEAEIVEQTAHEELGDSDREIGRMLRIVARNLNGVIRYGQEPLPVR